jgi:hypothetical protein
VRGSLASDNPKHIKFVENLNYIISYGAFEEGSGTAGRLTAPGRGSGE